ncbi:hypothetical protein FOA52_011968 [Chlamydomonas sp. UWO 241]|nr:hypothetical protein FOA52_011968 [Chlamydomonas sp. UWO 241]
MLMQKDTEGNTVLMTAAMRGFDSDNVIQVIRFLLDHPAAEPAAMLAATNHAGDTVLMTAATPNFPSEGVIRLLLDHPAADPAAMLAASNHAGETALIQLGKNTIECTDLTGIMLFLIDHPAADAAAMLAARSLAGKTVLTLMAEILQVYAESDMDNDAPVGDDVCVNLLFLLRRFRQDVRAQEDVGVARLGGGQVAYLAEQQQDLAAVVASMELMLRADSNPPPMGRDESVRLLLELGAPFPPGPVVSRVIRCEFEKQKRLSIENDQLRRMPHLIDAVVGLARRYPQHPQQPQHP